MSAQKRVSSQTIRDIEQVCGAFDKNLVAYANKAQFECVRRILKTAQLTYMETPSLFGDGVSLSVGNLTIIKGDSQ